MILFKLVGFVGLFSLVSAGPAYNSISTTKVSSISSILTYNPSADALAPLWGQCGGIGWTGPTVCVANTICTYSNPYHSQCLLGSNYSSTRTASSTITGAKIISISLTTTTALPPIPTSPAWGQCGGIGWTGPTVCEANTTCTYANAYHSQCIPGPKFSAPPTPTPTTTYVAAPEPTWSYVFSFGDSFTETGFDIAGTKPAVGNQLGNPAWPGLTTSGGLNWLGGILKDNPDLLSYNFATSGATTDASIIAPKIPTALSFVEQVSEFTTNLVPGPAYAPWVTNNTFFVIWIGNTDVTLAYNQSNWSTLCQDLITSYFSQVEILYNAGARSFMFMEIPPLESTPAMLSSSTADQAALTSAITQFNTLLNDQANILITKLGGNQFPASGLYTNFAQVVDTQAAFSAIINNPVYNGASNASCWDTDGTTCLWTDPWTPGVALQNLAGVYAAEIVGIRDYA